MRGKLVLVTGGAGFIGSHLCARLLKEGAHVISLDNYFAGSKENHVAGVEYREGHTKDIEKHVPETPDLIYHLGEYSRVEQSVLEPDVVHDLNIVGTLGVVEYWKKRKCKLVYAGSSTKFGDAGAARHTSPYASTKASNSELVKDVGEYEKLPYAITYFYNVYGPGERAGVYGTVVESFKHMYSAGVPFSIVSPGTQVRNFTHIDDIVDALVLVGEKGSGDEYGLGNERAYSILEVAQLFGGDTIMLPARTGNRLTAGLDRTKISALGWKPARTLENYIHEFTETHTRGAPREKRILVFSTTFYPTVGPAEQALIDLMRKMPDVQFDIVTTVFSRGANDIAPPISNAHVYRVGWGWRIDKYMLPLLGARIARKLHAKHRYMFTWSLMASYAALAGMFLKRSVKLPLLITLADQNLSSVSGLVKFVMKFILSDADQVYGISALQESEASHLKGKALRASLGDGDALANQLRYAYADILLHPVVTLNHTTGHKKKILIFSLSYFPSHVGGAEVAIKEITERNLDIDFHLIALRFDSTLPRTSKEGVVTVHRIGFGKKGATVSQTFTPLFYLAKIFYIPLAAWTAYHLHRREKFDAFWAMMVYMILPIVLLRFVGTRVPYAVTLQEGDPFERVFNRWYIRIVKPLLAYGVNHATVIQAISTFLAGWAKNLGYTQSVEVIPNAVDVAQFAYVFSDDVIAQKKADLEKKMGDVFLVTASRLVKKNAVDTVVRALAHLPTNVHFLIFGDGPDEKKYKALVHELNLESRVHFREQVSHTELPLILRACDIFIRPSRSEGMGNAFIEAMAAGLPVIGTQEGGIADFLFDEKRNPEKPVTGWAVDKDSPKQIAEVIIHIMSHPEKVRAVVRTAREMVKEKYDWELIARDMMSKVFSKLFTG